MSVSLCPAAMAQSARDYISIVGSSTVYPFTTTVAEQFGKSGSFKTPKVESTGTGGGFKLFCGGVGVPYPDVSNASRAHQAVGNRFLRQGRREGHRRSEDRLRRHCRGGFTQGRVIQGHAHVNSTWRWPRRYRTRQTHKP